MTCFVKYVMNVDKEVRVVVRWRRGVMVDDDCGWLCVLTLWLPRAPNGALKMPGLISHVVLRGTQQPQRLYPVYFAHVLTSVLIYIL